MPLSAAFPTLMQDIEKAFKDKQEAYESAPGDRAVTDAERTKIDKAFYLALATAIHNYTLSAQVVGSGSGPTSGVAAPLAPTGAAPVVGVANTVVQGNLL